MAEKTVEIQLSRAMTWAGVNYAPGLNKMPEAAASYAERRRFGRATDVQAEAQADTSDEQATGEQTTGNNSNQPETGLPEDFPMKHVFEKSGFKSVAEVQAKTREELIALDGIGEKSADAALAYVEKK